MTGQKLRIGLPSEPQTPDRDLPVIHQAAGALSALSGIAIDEALGWLDTASQSADVAAADIARGLIRVLEHSHAALRD